MILLKSVIIISKFNEIWHITIITLDVGKRKRRKQEIEAAAGRSRPQNRRPGTGSSSPQQGGFPVIIRRQNFLILSFTESTDTNFTKIGKQIKCAES